MPAASAAPARLRHGVVEEAALKIPIGWLCEVVKPFRQFYIDSCIYGLPCIHRLRDVLYGVSAILRLDPGARGRARCPLLRDSEIDRHRLRREACS